MVLPRRLKPKNKIELEHLTVERLMAYRKKALSLENSLDASDYHDVAIHLDQNFIWFKDDPRWQTVYNGVLGVLATKQATEGN